MPSEWLSADSDCCCWLNGLIRNWWRLWRTKGKEMKLSSIHLLPSTLVSCFYHLKVADSNNPKQFIDQYHELLGIVGWCLGWIFSVILYSNQVVMYSSFFGLEFAIYVSSSNLFRNVQLISEYFTRFFKIAFYKAFCSYGLELNCYVFI